MNISKFREMLAPLSESLKSEGDKLREAFNAVHENHLQVNREMRALYEAPAHRDELEALMVEFLDRLIKKQAEDFSRLTNGYRNGPFESRTETAKELLDAALLRNPDEAVKMLLMLAALHIKANLPAIVDQLPWSDGPHPTTRAQQLVVLEKKAAAISAELTELNDIASAVGIKLR